MIIEDTYSAQRCDEYKKSEQASTIASRDYKSATDLVVTSHNNNADSEKTASFYPQMKAESQCWREDDISTTLVNGTNPGYQNGIVDGLIVRRLTPTECERLQGYPDGWTDIGDWVDSKGKKHKGESDAPRYKALGNSIALPFWQWMAYRMVEVLNQDGVESPTMASLFDGIGGFPLVYQNAGCEPIWASEIEEFPIAVTKLRFPDKENDND